MSLIISWPGQFQQGMHSNALVELIDIVSTLLELDVPGNLQGAVAAADFNRQVVAGQAPRFRAL